MRISNFCKLLGCFFIISANVRGQEISSSSAGADDLLYAQRLLIEGYHQLAISQFREYLAKYPQSMQAPEALRSIGEAQFALSDFRGAVETLSQFEARYPNHSLVDQVRQQLGEAFVRLHDLKSAAATFQRLALFNPTSALSATARYRSASLWVAGGDHQRGRELLYQLMDDYPTSEARLPAHLLLVESFQQTGDAQRALQEAERLFRSFPEKDLTPQTHYARARLFEQVGQWQFAEEAYNNQLSSFPESEWTSRAQRRLAELAYHRGDVEQTNQLLQTAAGRLPASIEKNEMILRLAAIHLEWERYDAAQAALADFSTTGADSMQLLQTAITRGWLYEKTQEFQKSVQACDAAIAFPRKAEKWFADAPFDWQWPRQRSFLRAAVCELAQQHADRALAYCAAYRKEYPHGELLDQALWQEAEIRRQALQDPSRAARLYQQIIEDVPLSRLIDDAQLQLAMTYEQMGENRRAIHEYRRLLANYPASEHYEEAQRRLRLLEEFDLPEDDGQFAAMAKLLSEVAASQSTSNVEIELGKLALQRHELEKAIDYFREALAQGNENQAEALFHLGKAYALIAERATLRREENAQAWRDSAAIALTGVISDDENSKLAQEAGVYLARVRFPHRESITNREKLIQADSTLAAHADLQELDDLKLWAAQARVVFAKEDTVEANRLTSALQQFANRQQSPLRNEALYSLARWRWQSGDATSALENCAALESWPKGDPFKPLGMLLHAEILAEIKRHEEAAKLLAQFERQYFYSALADSARLRRVRCLLSAGQYQEAIDLMNSMGAALPSSPGTDGLALPRAQAYALLENYPVAIRAYLKFLNDHPQAPEAAGALLAAARLTGRVGARQLASNYAEECIRRFPGSAEAMEAKSFLADLRFDEGRFETARQLYQEAARENNDNEKKKHAAKQAIICIYKSPNGVVGESELKSFQKEFPDDKIALAEIQHAIGEQALANKDFKNADAIFQKLRKDFKDTPSGILGDYGLGKSLLIQNKSKEALEVLTDIPRRYPNHSFLPTVYLGLGDFYLAQQQWDNAIASFTKVTKDSTFDSHYRLAVRSLINGYDRMGLWDRALGLLRGYLVKFPDDEFAFAMKMQIGTFLMNLMQFEDAIAHLRKLKPFADAQTEPEIQYYIGKSYMNAGRFELAIPEFLRVKYFSKPTKLPWDVTALYEAGICFMRLKDYEKARDLFRRIVREQGAESNFGRFAKEKINELEQLMAQSGEKDG